MHITHNNTGLLAGLCVATDKAAHDHCVVVIKGTFTVDDHAEARMAEVQRPLVHADEHHGEPGATSIRHESDFAPVKRFTDILVHGDAVAPDERPVRDMQVRLDMPGRSKTVMVHGDRQWDRRVMGLSSTPPQPFVRMPLRFERAYGGTDCTHPETKYHGSELHNPIGRGFRSNPRPADAVGTLLPNLEDPRHPMLGWNDRPRPMALSVVGRGWQPRIRFAGSYDQTWLRDTFPFLPADFDTRYFQSAPIDQQLPHVQGGEQIIVHGASAGGPWTTRLPQLNLPIRFRFRDRDVVASPVLDTVLLDCNEKVLVLCWRASVRLGKKLTALSEIEVGTRPPSRPVHGPVGTRRGKPLFRGLSTFIAWKRRLAPDV